MTSTYRNNKEKHDNRLRLMFCIQGIEISQLNSNYIPAYALAIPDF